MPINLSDWFVHLTPVFMMMGAILINHTVTHQRTEKRTDLEASRFRAALAAEMRALLDLYDTNLDLLVRGCDFVLSARQLTPVYKGNLGRLTILLEGEEAARVVTAFARSEKIELILTARTQPKNNSSYKLVAGDLDAEELKILLTTTARSIQAACEALESSAGHNDRQDSARQVWLTQRSGIPCDSQRAASQP